MNKKEKSEEKIEMKNKNNINIEFEEVDNIGSIRSLLPEEREFILQWSDADKDIISIYASYQPWIKKLLDNPLFKCEHKSYNEGYRCHPNPISVEGYLPRRCLTIRKTLRKRELTPEQKKEFSIRMKKSKGA